MNIYKQRKPAIPLSPNQQIDIMLSLEQEEAQVIGEPSSTDMEVCVALMPADLRSYKLVVMWHAELFMYMLS